MNETNSRLALVTGAASGIGEATVRRLLESGGRVIALDRSQEGLDRLTQQAPCDRLIPCLFDVEHTRDIPELLNELMQRHGPIGQLVNNAGVWDGAPVTQLTDQQWELNMAVNVTAPFVLMRGVARAMAERGGGAIVTVASRNAFRSSVNNAAYDASKAAVLALTRTAAGEFAGLNIRVNAVCPGVIATPGNSDSEEPLFKAAYTKLIPMDRYGQPDEIAAVITFLLSDDASFITGESILVDGGQLSCQDNGRFMQIPDLKP